jgi:ankyrin repeat protein
VVEYLIQIVSPKRLNEGLSVALELGHWPVVNLLAKGVTYIRINNLEKNFQRACSENQDEFIEQYLQKGPLENEVVKEIAKEGLQTASARGHLETVTVLLEDPRVPLSNEALTDACKNGKLRIVQKLLDGPRNMDPTFTYDLPFVTACTYNHAEVVEYLLTKPKIDPSAIQNTGLLWACRHGSTRIVKALLASNRVDPKVPENRAMEIAKATANDDLVNLLIMYSQ